MIVITFPVHIFSLMLIFCFRIINIVTTNSTQQFPLLHVFECSRETLSFILLKKKKSLLGPPDLFQIGLSTLLLGA